MLHPFTKLKEYSITLWVSDVIPLSLSFPICETRDFEKQSDPSKLLTGH